MKRRRLRTKLLLTTLGLSVGFVVVALTILSLMVERLAHNEATQDLTQGQRAYEFFASSRRRSLADQARSLARIPLLAATLGYEGEIDRASASALLEDLRRSVPDTAFAIGNTRGKILASTIPRLSFGHDASTKGGVSQALMGEPRAGVWRVDEHSMLSALEPVLSGEQIVGFVALVEAVDSDFARRVRLVTGRDVLVAFDDDIVADSWTRNFDRATTKAFARAVCGPDGEHDVGVIEAKLGEDRRFALAMPLDHHGGTLVLSRSLAEIGRIAERATSQMWIAAILIVSIGAFVSLSVAKRVTTPLRSLAEASQELAAGHLDASVRVTSADEVGQLGDAFNDMARRIETLVHVEQEHAQRAEAANRAKDRFLTSVSHELRTPLTNVHAYAELLMTYGPEAGEESKDFLGIIHGESTRLMGLIDNLLDFVRLETGEMTWACGVFELGELVRQTVDGLHDFESAARLDVEIAGCATHCRGDSKRVQQAVLELLKNAAKFSDADTPIQVRVGCDDEHAELRISDAGCGIPDEAKERIFERFHQEGDVITGKTDGTGIGLSLVKEIVEHHEGSIHVEDVVPHGASFVVRLPRMIVADAPGAAATQGLGEPN